MSSTAPARDDSLPIAEVPTRDAYLAPGPLAWIVTIAVTTVLLVASAKALFLVVPFLLAIILYYMLYPLLRRLELGGMRRDTAAALVAGGVAVAAVAVLVPTVPWLVAQSVSGEEMLGRYVEGGRVLIHKTLTMMESQFAFLRRMDFAAEAGRRLDQFGDTLMKEQLAESLLKAAAQLPSVLLAPFLAFFFLKDGGRFLRTVVSVVPNAFFERTVHMFDSVHQTARNYFQGLLKLTVADATMYAIGLLLIGVSGAVVLALVAAVLSWIPVIGSALAFAIIVLAAATEFPNSPFIVFAAIGLFLSVRFLDTFVIMPLTVGRSIRMHPVPSVLMLFIGGSVAGIAGLILAIPLAGVVSTIIGTIGAIIDDPRLHARHRFAKALESRRVNADLDA
ncbi:MAG TPA: AI-2E family transporter [Burkholderiales bacterium]|nr:AI-2E family transporter [Burkholderiales bacterium]